MQQTQGLEKIQQGWDRLTLGKQTLKAMRWFDQAVIQTAQVRIDAGQDENSARVQAQDENVQGGCEKFSAISGLLSHPLASPVHSKVDAWLGWLHAKMRRPAPTWDLIGSCIPLWSSRGRRDPTLCGKANWCGSWMPSAVLGTLKVENEKEHGICSPTGT